jgi:SAM-dependent methyltransferase
VTDAESELRARRASSFGEHAAAYAEHRPDYPRKALRWGLSGATRPVHQVLDLGAGTGKLTAGLAELDLDVTAVEPDPGMLAELTRLLPSVTALTGRAERIPLADAAVDAVFAGQAFHWFDQKPALDEIARVLRPGGVLVLIWNRDDESVPWVVEFHTATRTGMSRSWQPRDGDLEPHPEFTTFEEETFRHAQRRTADSLVQTIATQSHILVSPPEESAAKLRELREFLAANPETADGEFDYPLKTQTFRARRR